MIDKEVLASRISTIKSYSIQLKSLLDEVAQADFAGTPKHFLLGERLLEVIVQSMLDIGSHIISGLQLEKPSDYHDIVTILVKNKIIPAKFAPRMHSLIGLRNLLAHEYIIVDHNQLYKDAKNGLKDFAEFCRYATKSLGRR